MCKNCTNFEVSNCFLLLSEQLINLHTIDLSSSIFRSDRGSPSTQLLQEDTPSNVQEWQLKCILISFIIVRLEN